MIFDRRLVAATVPASLIMGACLILGGCEKQSAQGNKATGEVLEGTITDAMIATDEVRSEPPLAPHTAKAADAKGEKSKGKAADDGEVEAAPAADPGTAADASPPPQPSASEPAG